MRHRSIPNSNMAWREFIVEEKAVGEIHIVEDISLSAVNI